MLAQTGGPSGLGIGGERLVQGALRNGLEEQSVGMGSDRAEEASSTDFERSGLKKWIHHARFAQTNQLIPQLPRPDSNLSMPVGVQGETTLCVGRVSFRAVAYHGGAARTGAQPRAGRLRAVAHACGFQSQGQHQQP